MAPPDRTTVIERYSEMAMTKLKLIAKNIFNLISFIFVIGYASSIFINFGTLFWKTPEADDLFFSGRIGEFFGEMVGHSLPFMFIYVISKYLNEIIDLKYNESLKKIIVYLFAVSTILFFGFNLSEYTQKIYQVFCAAVIILIVIFRPNLLTTGKSLAVLFFACQLFHLSEWDAVFSKMSYWT
jgi:hypothetical protein